MESLVLKDILYAAVADEEVVVKGKQGEKGWAYLASIDHF